MKDTYMQVIKMDERVVSLYVKGCIKSVKDENKTDTYKNGNLRGIDDALKLVNDKNDLTQIMNTAILGLKHQYDESTDPFFNKPDWSSHFVGYKSGLTEAILIITGQDYSDEKSLR